MKLTKQTRKVLTALCTTERQEWNRLQSIKRRDGLSLSESYSTRWMAARTGVLTAMESLGLTYKCGEFIDNAETSFQARLLVGLEEN